MVEMSSVTKWSLQFLVTYINMSFGSVKDSESFMAVLKAKVAEVLELMERKDSGLSIDVRSDGYVTSCPASVCKSDD